jgi:hypothetical protein
MDYRTQLAKENSKKNTNLIVASIGKDQQKFDAIIHLFFNADIRLIQRASNVVGIIGEKQPQLIDKHVPSFINALQTSKVIAVKRNIVRVFQFYKHLPFNNGTLFDICLKFVASNDEALAVKAFSITICRRYCEKYPELTEEVIPTLELLIEENKSPGIQSRGKKELKNLLEIKKKYGIEL